MKTPLPLVLSCAFLTSAALPAFAAPESKGRSSETAATSDKDKEKLFLQKAGTAGLAEVSLAEAAKTKATGEHAKMVAEKLVTDHTGANTELAALAKSKSIDIPEPGAKEKKVADDLLKKSGSAFDTAFLEQMAAAHKKDIALFESASKQIQDPDTKAFVDKTLPVLKAHAAMIMPPKTVMKASLKK